MIRSIAFGVLVASVAVGVLAAGPGWHGDRWYDKAGIEGMQEVILREHEDSDPAKPVNRLITFELYTANVDKVSISTQYLGASRADMVMIDRATFERMIELYGKRDKKKWPDVLAADKAARKK